MNPYVTTTALVTLAAVWVSAIIDGITRRRRDA